jgi:cellulose synthase/poly-beta-1,6-N-acetylglucosamine synthase-like glycosyltransferase
LGIIGSRYKPYTSKFKSKNVEIVIVSIADERVKNSLFECINHTYNNFPNILISVIIDEGAQLTESLSTYINKYSLDNDTINNYGNSIKEAVRDGSDKGIRLRVVPKDYRNDLIAKGRAINYFIENHVKDSKWYVFIDDDNLILDDNFLYEIPYYDLNGYSAFNPILKPRKGKSKLASIIDLTREYDDISIYRFFVGLIKSPLIGMHGEMLGVRGSVLKEIGFDFNSITEDFRFSIELVKKNMKTWQSKTKISIMSPNSLLDVIKQRGRVYKGITIDLRSAKSIVKIIMGLKLTLWLVAIFGSYLLSPIWFFWSGYEMFVLLVGGIYPLAVFVYASKNAKDIKQILFSILLIPFIGVFDSLSFLIGLRQKGFIVINKD